MKPLKNRLNLTLASLIHAILLCGLTFWVINTEYTHWDDGEIVWVNNILKKVILKVDDQIDEDEFIFINVCYDNTLIDKVDDDGFVLGNQDITDRKKLARFFKAVNEYPSHKLILTDITFEESSPFDSLLEKQITKVPRLICSYHQKSDTSYNKPIFDVPIGLSDYSNDGDFLKYKFIRNKTIKTTPVVMFESITGKTLRPSSFFFNYDNSYFLNNCILDLRIRDYHLKQNSVVSDSLEFHAKYIQLGDLLMMTEYLGNQFIGNEIKNRIVVLGDFEDRDLHGSTVGNIPGALILANGYLSLKNKDNEVTFFMILYLLICYFILSYFLFSADNLNIENFFGSFIWLSRFKFVLEFLGYFIFLFLMAFSVYIIFGIQYSVILIALYIKLIDWVLDNFFRR